MARRRSTLRLLCSVALAFLFTSPDPEFAMAIEPHTAIDVVRIAYHGPQDKPVPPLVLGTKSVEDADALFERLGLTTAEDSFGAFFVVVDAQTLSAIAEATSALESDAQGAAALISASAIDTTAETATTATLSRSAGRAYLTRVRTLADGKRGGADIAGWIARTNLVAS